MLSNLKRSLGGACKYLSFSVDKVRQEDGSWQEVFAVKAVMLNDFKTKDTVVISLGDKKPQELTENDYRNIYYTLNSREYERRND